MEVDVGKLELMFQKADSDLNYIEYRLEYKIKTNHTDSSSQKISVTVLKKLHQHGKKEIKLFFPPTGNMIIV
uniref:Ska2 N-terminal domain-containing protein n=1 Tax=Urocitellus parryii TaxID=9999 RepID=A0A8D2H8V4_UROPR